MLSSERIKVVHIVLRPRHRRAGDGCIGLGESAVLRGSILQCCVWSIGGR